MRLMLSAVFIAVTTLIGVEFAGRIRSARDTLAEMISLCMHMTVCVRYDRCEPDMMICSFDRRKKSALEVCADCVNAGQSFSAAWEYMLSHSAVSRLSADELAIVRELGLGFGKSDIDSETARLCHLKERLDEAFRQRCGQCAQQCRLYITSGFLCGMLITILLY